MFNPLTDIKKSDKSFNGFYRGIVVDNNDPLKAGRIRIRVMPIFNDIPIEHLPWAIYADGMMGGNMNNGGVYIPDIESHVFLFFESGDHRFPVFFAGAPAIQQGTPDIPTWSRESDDIFDSIDTNSKKGINKAGGGNWDEPSSTYNSQYPNNKVFRTSKGIVIEYDDTDDNVRIHVYHPSGTREEINNSGDRIEHNSNDKFTITITDDNIFIGGNQNITITGNQNIKCDGNQTVEATNVKIDADGCDINTTGDTNIKASGNISLKGSTIQLN